MATGSFFQGIIRQEIPMNDWILAIDPGVSGGLVIRHRDPEKPVEARRMPKGERAIADFFYALGAEPGLQAVYLEKVWGRESDSKRSINTFMLHTGFLRGCVIGLLIFPGPTDPKFVDVLPNTWQRAMDCPKMSRDKTIKHHIRKRIHKNALKTLAIEHHPDLKKVTLYTADALLIAEYAAREEGW